MKLNKLSLFSIIGCLTLITFSCGGNQENKEEQTQEQDTTVIEDVEIIEEDVTYTLPSPLQVAHLFKNAGLIYIGGLTNPIEKAESYNTKYDQKLNFGVYAADMAYCVMNNQSQTSIDYFTTMRKLSEKLWMTDIFNSLGLGERIEKNMGNEDSLVYIMADLQMQMDDYLEENGMNYTGAIIFAGAWVESMYLGAEVNKQNKDNKINSKIAEQAVVLDNLIKGIKQNNTENEFDELVADLEKINAHFTSLNIETDEELTFTDEQIVALSNDIIEVRNNIVNLN